MKNIYVLSDRSRFPTKLICCTAFGSAFSFCFLLKPVTIFSNYSLKYGSSNKQPVA